jgi:hypothetical protein
MIKYSRQASFIFVSLLFALGSDGSPAPLREEALLEPVEALELVQSEPLKYVGSFYPSNSESGKIPSCLFRNSKVTVMYTYCRKSEAPALSFTVYSNVTERGNIRFYAEGNGRPVSQLDRQEYVQYMWKFLARTNTPGYRSDFSAKEYSEYYDREIKDYHLGCYIWEQYGHPDLKAKCVAPFDAQSDSWLPGAVQFWHEPPAAWYLVQKDLRQLVVQLRNFEGKRR